MNIASSTYFPHGAGRSCGIAKSILFFFCFSASVRHSDALRRRQHPCRSLVLNNLSSLRGGSDYYNKNGKSPIELNPNYDNYAQNAIEHEVWLQQQQPTLQQQQTTHTRFSFSPKKDTILNRIQQYMTNLHQTSPSLFWTTISCMLVFVLWQIPPMDRFLLKMFVCNRSNLIQTAGASLVLSAVSHNSFYHLLVNLATLFFVGPTVANQIIPRKPLWPLLLGSAMASNALFILGRRAGSCMGLSGVTMSLLAIQARAFPKRMVSIMVLVIPVSLPSEHILQLLLVVSFAGSFLRGSKIAHLTHLGGLLFGLLYYELFINSNGRRQRQWRWMSRKGQGRRIR